MRLRTLFFLINFGLSVLFMVCCVVAAGSMQTPFSFLGGIMFFPFGVAFAVMEWIGWYRNQRGVELAAAIISLILAAFMAFAAITSAGEALLKGWPDGFGWFVSTFLLIAAYFAACGIWRIWLRPNHPLSAPSGASADM